MRIVALVVLVVVALFLWRRFTAPSWGRRWPIAL